MRNTTLVLLCAADLVSQDPKLYNPCGVAADLLGMPEEAQPAIQAFMAYILMANSILVSGEVDGLTDWQFTALVAAAELELEGSGEDEDDECDCEYCRVVKDEEDE